MARKPTRSSVAAADLRRIRARHRPRRAAVAASAVGAAVEAKGLIVWITNPTRASLRPALAHGYSSQALAMMGTLPREGDNATSLAYREARIETVPSEAGGLAALVVPLMSPSGCAGAVAVEMPAGLETRRNTQALAVIVAAQLGALVALPHQEAVRSKAEA